MDAIIKVDKYMTYGLPDGVKEYSRHLNFMTMGTWDYKIGGGEPEINKFLERMGRINQNGFKVMLRTFQVMS